MMTPEPAWTPDEVTVERANLTALMRDRGIDTYADLHRWSVEIEPASGEPWLTGSASASSASRKPSSTAPIRSGPIGSPAPASTSLSRASPRPRTRSRFVYARAGRLHRMTYGQLRAAVDRFAHGFVAADFGPGDRVAITMPMTIESVIAYLGVVLAGGVVVSIADSFAPHEIATRLGFTEPVATVTQDRVLRAGRELPMYEKLCEAGAPGASSSKPAASSLFAPRIRAGTVSSERIDPSPQPCGRRTII